MTGLNETTAKMSTEIDMTWGFTLIYLFLQISEFRIYWTRSPAFWAFQTLKYRFVHNSVLMLWGNRSFRYIVARITVLHGQSSLWWSLSIRVRKLSESSSVINHYSWFPITRSIANSNLALTQTKIDFPRISFIAGLHLTSRQPCWWSRTKAFLSSGN